jgi:Ser/Thr protein kinase RdoA (MazF antagonist)
MSLTRAPLLDVSHAMYAVDVGSARVLDGRGVNTSYLVGQGGREYAVKVHVEDESSGRCLERILCLDASLRGIPWYPPVIDAGLYGPRRQVVVVRRFARGTPLNQLGFDIDTTVAVLARLAAAGTMPPDRPKDLVSDYATPWLAAPPKELRSLQRFGDADRETPSIVDRHLAALLNSAQTLKARSPILPYHGDLHGGNIILGRHGRITVIDWDEAGYACRPADAAKALWLCCRRERGQFVLDAAAMRGYLRQLHARLGLPYADAIDLARLGAIWFVPAGRHVDRLVRRQPEAAPWYFDWIGRFWQQYESNLGIVAAVADALASA